MTNLYAVAEDILSIAAHNHVSVEKALKIILVCDLMLDIPLADLYYAATIARRTSYTIS